MRLAAALLLVALVALGTASPAEACATCFGDPDSAMSQGMNNGILALLGFIGVVQVGFVALFASFIIRSRRLRERKDRFRLIRGGAR